MINALSKLTSLAAATLISATLLAGSVQPSYAGPGPDYRLTTAEQTSGTRIASETLWRCNANSCSAATSTSRPAVVCAQAARELGKLQAFAFRGEAFDDAALDKCNSRAR